MNAHGVLVVPRTVVGNNCTLDYLVFRGWTKGSTVYFIGESLTAKQPKREGWGPVIYLHKFLWIFG